MDYAYLLPQNVINCETSGAEIGHQQLRRASWTVEGKLSFRVWWTVDRLIVLLELDATRTRGPLPQLCALIRKPGFDGDSLANVACVDPSFGLVFF